ncbi:3-methyl-2-oxobutanoate hydroxymethyltransferase [Marinilabiliaceae bacterium ANBcel2]|nr:3-methyl-2-oxobutanoate hydroxymethyltransferase [Marinilabiliaceae bacterium ANBcel2]
MSTAKESTKRVTVTELARMKSEGEKISMLTAYDYTMATIIDRAGTDILLVGDSAANVMAGWDTTIPITVDHMIYHAASVKRAAKRAMVVVDMPFGSYQGNSIEAINSAVKIMKETSADALKLEGGVEIMESIERILSAGIPVMGHLGLTPQSINKFGGYSIRAKEDKEADRLISDALALEKAGVFAIVLEKIPATLAQKATNNLSIPTIGIGAGNKTDGQVLVIQDMLGMNQSFSPKFLRRYHNLHEEISGAVKNYINDVKSSDFPNEKEQY